MSGAFKKPVFSFKLLKILTVTLLAIPVASHLLSRHGAAVARRAQRCYSKSHNVTGAASCRKSDINMVQCNSKVLGRGSGFYMFIIFILLLLLLMPCMSLQSSKRSPTERRASFAPLWMAGFIRLGSL